MSHILEKRFPKGVTLRRLALAGLAFLASETALSRALCARGLVHEGDSQETAPLWAYFGTYTKQDSEGIYAAGWTRPAAP